MNGIDFDFNKIQELNDKYDLDSEDILAKQVSGEDYFFDKDTEFTLDNDLTYEECFEEGFLRGVIWYKEKMKNEK